MVKFTFEIVNISKSTNIIAYATLICHRDIQLEVEVNQVTTTLLVQFIVRVKIYRVSKCASEKQAS